MDKLEEMAAALLSPKTLDWLPNYRFGPDGSVWSGTRKLTPNVDHKGYLRIRLTVKGRERRFILHRLICEAFSGPPPFPKAETCHFDGNKTNNHHTNLRWGTATDNAQDRKRHGRERAKFNGLSSRKYRRYQPRVVQHHGPIGEAHGSSKLTEEQVREIRRAIESGEHTVSVGGRYGVGRTAIQRIMNGRTWSHVL